jgi:hypothetical protein
VVVSVLLVVGLACLVLGVLLASSPWLIGSLAAGAVAAVVLYRRRSQIGTAAQLEDAAGPASSGGAGPAPVATALVTGTSFAARRRPRRAAPSRPDLRVWVVDGRPAYHLGQCTVLDDLPAGIAPERVPLPQALEDGFAPCPTCEPTERRLMAGSAAVLSGAKGSGPVGPGTDPQQVWVVDGRPRYHRTGCLSVAGQPAEPIPYWQAIGDGFAPCPRCEPDAVES